MSLSWGSRPHHSVLYTCCLPWGPILLVGGLGNSTWLAVTKQSSCVLSSLPLCVGSPWEWAYRSLEEVIPSPDSSGGTKSLFVHLGGRVLQEKLTTLAAQQSCSQGTSPRSFCTGLPGRAAICSSVRPLYIPVSSLPIDFVIWSL